MKAMLDDIKLSEFPMTHQGTLTALEYYLKITRKSRCDGIGRGSRKTDVMAVHRAFGRPQGTE
jgi:hypothetical protein